jgi:hypothetical protein
MQTPFSSAEVFNSFRPAAVASQESLQHGSTGSEYVPDGYDILIATLLLPLPRSRRKLRAPQQPLRRTSRPRRAKA